MNRNKCIKSVCQRCGYRGTLRVVETRKNKDWVHRYLECPCCNGVFATTRQYNCEPMQNTEKRLEKAIARERETKERYLRHIEYVGES